MDCGGVALSLYIGQGFHSHEARWRILLGVSTSSGTWTPQGRASAVLFWLCWWWYRLWASGNRIWLLVLCLCPSLYETVLDKGTPAMIVVPCLQPELVVASLRCLKVFKGLVGIVARGLCPMGRSSGLPRGSFVTGSCPSVHVACLSLAIWRPRMDIRHQPTSMPWITSSLTSPSVLAISSQ